MRQFNLQPQLPMETEECRQELELCLAVYEELQLLHLELMEHEPMPDLSRMTSERDNAFVKLKQSLNAFIKKTGAHGVLENIPALAEYNDRITSIIDVSEKLSWAIMQYRENLKTDIAMVKKSRDAMAGYGAANINHLTRGC